MTAPIIEHDAARTTAWPHSTSLARLAAPYALALLATLLACAATQLSAPVLRNGTYLFFYLAVLITSIYGGLGPGLLGTILAVLAVDYLFIPPVFSLDPSDPQDAIGLLVFSATSLIASSLSSRLRKTRDAAAAQVQLLEEQRRRIERQSQHLRSQTAALLRANTQLEDARAAADSARRDAEAASRGKLHALLALSDVLEPPLKGIAGGAQSLEHGIHGLLNAAQRATVRDLHAQQRSASRLLADAVRYARLGVQQMNFTIAEVPVDQVIRTASELVAPLLRANSLELYVSPYDQTIRVCADQSRLEHILYALLMRAARMSEREHALRMECDAEGASIALRLQVRGAVSDGETLARLFEPVPADGGTADVAGEIALDLPISRLLARAMGGDLRVHADGPGVVIFTLTMLRVARGGAAAVGVPRPATPRPAFAAAVRTDDGMTQASLS